MTEHELRMMRYQIQNLLNHMTANAYEYGVYIQDGEAFGDLLMKMEKLINVNLNIHPPDKKGAHE